MGKNLDDFKQFVKVHPGLNDLVSNKSRSWQEIYEDWTFYKEDSKWEEYKDTNSIKLIEEVNKPDEPVIENTIKEGKTANVEEMMKGALAYVKKINPDTITKTVTNAQKILALISGLGIGGAAAIAKNSNTGDPLFDKRFDEWY